MSKIAGGQDCKRESFIDHLTPVMMYRQTRTKLKKWCGTQVRDDA